VCERGRERGGRARESEVEKHTNVGPAGAEGKSLAMRAGGEKEKQERTNIYIRT